MGGMESRRSTSLSRAFSDVFGELHLLDLGAEFLDFRVLVDFVAQFFMDGLDLFPQVVFFLLLVHLAADFHVQLRFQVGNVDFRIQERRNAAQARFDVSRFQELLADDQAQGQLGCSEVSQDARFVDVLGIFAGFFAVAEIAHPVQEPLEDDPAQGFFFDFVAADFSHFDGSPFEVIGFLGKALHADAGNAVDQDADQAARHAQELFDLDQAADGIDIVKTRIVFVFIDLGRYQELPVVFHGVVDGSQGRIAADVDVADQLRIDDDAPERDKRQGQDILLVEHNVFVHTLHLLLWKNKTHFRFKK